MSSSGKASRKRASSSNRTQKRKESKKNNRFRENWSPNRGANMSLMMPTMPPMVPMGYPGAHGPFIPMPAYDGIHATITPSSGMPYPLYQPSMAESVATGLTAASSHKSLITM